MVSKINYKSIRLPVMASARELGPWQCPIFRLRNFNIKIGPGDEANLEVVLDPLSLNNLPLPLPPQEDSGLLAGI